MNRNKTWSRNILIAIFIGLLYIIFSSLSFMLSAFLGAITLFVLLKKSQKFLVIKKRWNPYLAVVFLMIGSLLLIVLPFYFVAVYLINNAIPLVNNPEPLISAFNTVDQYLESNYNIKVLNGSIPLKALSFLNNILPKILNSGLSIVSNLVLLYFILWFMLLKAKKMEIWVKNNLPMGLRESVHLLQIISKQIYSNAIGVYLLAIVQALFAILGYWIFGFHAPIVWGCITGVASVIPVIGTMAVWVPLAIYSIAIGKVTSGIGLALYGLIIIGSSDNVFRFILQKKLASTHPLITILGVFLGLNLMGFWGLVFGPVLLVLFIEIYYMLKKRSHLD